MDRRHFLTAAGGLMVAQALAQPQPKLKISVFSKHLQFLQGEALAQGCAEIGFDGVDLAVREGGHVEPATVAADLPKLVKQIRQQGLDVPMITTGIVDAETPHAEAVLQAMTELGIHHYRWGGFKYDANQNIEAQLNALKPRIAKLAALNAKYKAGAMYHTHSGVGQVGASIWDLYYLLRDFDPKAVGVNYDIGHATVEGGLGGWINSFHITGKHLQGIAVKDVMWVKNAKGAWKADWQPLGTGMVLFPQFFQMVAQAGFQGPLQIHYEYPLGGADAGKRQITISKSEVFAAMKKDVLQLRTYLRGANLA